MDIVSDTSQVEHDNAAECETPPKVDAIIHVSIVKNELEAYLNIEPPSNGGAPPTVDAMKTALSDCGVSYNINIDTLNDMAAAPIYDRDILISSGVAPVNGIDGTVSFNIKTGEKVLKPKENEDGTVDYHDLGIVENVSEGQVLCVITPPTEGSPGISVKGKDLPQKKGKKAPSYIGKNTAFSEDGTVIISKINGHVEFDGRRINVNDTFYVKEDVDNSTGNIMVSGNLVVAGVVLPGLKIEAGKNIIVKGRVENAAIKAGGNINLQSGIIGSKIYCDGDLKCRFIESCNVFVKGDINAEYIINSDIKCGKSIKIMGSIAKIIGGTYIAGQNIEAQTIGSSANANTKIELGTDPTVINRQQELLVQIPELEKQIESLKPLMTILRQLETADRLTPEKRQVFDDVSYSYDTNMKLHADAQKELEDIGQWIKTKGFGRIICTGTIHPGTQIVIGGSPLTITNALDNTTLYYDEGNICSRPTR